MAAPVDTSNIVVAYPSNSPEYKIQSKQPLSSDDVDLLLFDSNVPKPAEKAINKRASELSSFIRSTLGEVRLQGLDYGPHQMTGIHDLKVFWGKGAHVDVRI